MSRDSSSAADARTATASTLDVVIIGAGFAGIYMLHRLRELGFTARAFEAGDGVGGTWYWNRYPGARCDVESAEYSFAFSKEIEQEWEWSELMAPQPEIESYLNYVVDKLELRPHIQLSTRVSAMTFDEGSSEWLVETDAGERYRSQFVVAATGCLSAPLEPDIPGTETFAGVSLYTNRFPKEGHDFTGQRVGVIGTGSSGVQAIPVIAEQASHLWVFQRSAAYTWPAENRVLRAGELDEVKANYAELRMRQRKAPGATVRHRGMSVEFDALPTDLILETPLAERYEKLERLGWGAPLAWADVGRDMEANRAGRELYAELVRREVRDPETAEALIPDYPMGCKRPILDTGYFDTFNQDHVTLVDLRRSAIRRLTPRGIETEHESFELDTIVFATGFDAMTGALNRIDIRGRAGIQLRDHWAHGPCTYLGIQVTNFPNLFIVTGPGSPSVKANMAVAIEHHVEWISECLRYLRERGQRTIEPSEAAQEEWTHQVHEFASGSVQSDPSCNSWYLGANVPGKTRVHMVYLGGFPRYDEVCRVVSARDYEGFVIREQ